MIKVNLTFNDNYSFNVIRDMLDKGFFETVQNHAYSDREDLNHKIEIYTDISQQMFDQLDKKQEKSRVEELTNNPVKTGLADNCPTWDLEEGFKNGN